MPKSKKIIKGVKEKDKEETKEIILDDEEKAVDPEMISGDIMDEDMEDEDVSIADDDEVDPFKDRWEE